MRKRSGTSDFAQNARRVVEQAIGEPLINKPKNPAAQALGRLGGKKGGPARAAKMTQDERTESARNAAKERWKKARKAAKIKAGS